MMIWGIDPGLNGGVVLLDTSVDCNPQIFDMPTLQVGKSKREVSPILLADILMEDANAPVVVEKVSAMPGQGVTSMFNFGKGYGYIMGVLAGLQMRVVNVTPNRWKKDMKLAPGKDASRERAMQLHPQISDRFARKKEDGRAEALLLAWWGARFGMEEF